MTVWFTSDQHFDHPFMSKTFRGFSRTSKHDDQLIRDWNDVVLRGDCVVVLGDVFWTNYQHITAIWGQLNGSKILVKGNHDHIWLKPTKGLSHHIIYEHKYKVKGGSLSFPNAVVEQEGAWCASRSRPQSWGFTTRLAQDGCRGGCG